MFVLLFPHIQKQQNTQPASQPFMHYLPRPTTDECIININTYTNNHMYILISYSDNDGSMDSVVVVVEVLSM
jgi:hypothetical protein